MTGHEAGPTSLSTTSVPRGASGPASMKRVLEHGNFGLHRVQGRTATVLVTAYCKARHGASGCYPRCEYWLGGSTFTVGLVRLIHLLNMSPCRHTRTATSALTCAARSTTTVHSHWSTGAPALGHFRVCQDVPGSVQPCGPGQRVGDGVCGDRALA